MVSSDPPVGKYRRIALYLAVLAVLVGLSVWFWRDFCLWRGTSALRQRKLAAAESWVARSQWFHEGDDPQACLLEIRIARRQQQFQLVESKLQLASKMGVPKSELRRERLLAMAQTGQFSAMQANWSDLLTDPRDDGPEIARAYYTWTMLNHNLELANKTLDLWQKDYPKDPEPHELRGRFNQSIYNWAEAESDYRRALALDPDNDDFRLALASVMLERLKTNDAVPLFKEYLSRHPDNLTAIRGLAQCAATAGDLDTAIELLRGAMENHPDDFNVQKSYGEVLLAANRASEAAAVLEKAYRSVPEHANLAYSLARSLKASGRGNEAEPLLAFVAESRAPLDQLTALERQLRSEPGNLELRMQIAAIVAKYISRQDAIRWYQNLLQISPDYPPAHRELVALYHQAGDLEKAQFHQRVLEGRGEAKEMGDQPISDPASPTTSDADRTP
ncbi:tetratricopeptide repeat protein [Schlesneria sp. T3-172]|uniref:tetratricopeptide repeat protein n=1 Tax=Schlesneria sphaerica TaxID=3373610 RepID=UPI0037C575FF